MKQRDIAVFLFKEIIYDFTANIKSNFISVFYCITNCAFHICNKNSVTRNHFFNNAKLQVFFFPKIKVDWRKFWQTNFSFCFYCNTSGRRHLCRQSIVSECTVKTKHPMGHNALYIYHVVGQSRRFHIDALTKPHKHSFFLWHSGVAHNRHGFSLRPLL